MREIQDEVAREPTCYKFMCQWSNTWSNTARTLCYPPFDFASLLTRSYQENSCPLKSLQNYFRHPISSLPHLRHNPFYKFSPWSSLRTVWPLSHSLRSPGINPFDFYAAVNGSSGNLPFHSPCLWHSTLRANFVPSKLWSLTLPLIFWHIYRSID